MVKHRARRRAVRPAGLLILLRALAALFAVAVIGFVILSDVRPGGAPSLDPAPGPTLPSKQETTAVVVTDTLNVRDGASIDAAVIDTLSQGSRLEVLGPASNGFTPVRHGAGRAWMASEYLTIDGASVVSAEIPAARPRDVPEPETAAAPEDPRQAEEPPEDASLGDVPGDEAVVQERWIDVDRTTGVVTLHEGASIVSTYVGRTGQDASADGYFSTAPGTFHVYSMNKALAETPFAYGVYLTDWVGFDPERSNGFHSPARDALGNVQPTQNATTLGCVRLDAEAAVAVFEFSYIGMRVEIHD